MKKFNFYKATTLVLLVALIATLAVSLPSSVSAGHRQCVVANNICVVVNGQQMTLQEYVNQQQTYQASLQENLNGLVCRVDYLGVGMGGFFGQSINELRMAVEYLSYLYPAGALTWTPFPTPPSEDELGDWCAQHPD